MPKIGKLIIAVFTILFFSCKEQQRYPYAIKDFRQSLQPHLTKIVSTGIVGYSDDMLSTVATDKELEQLGLSEHPVLRGSAYREMLRRKSFNHFDVLMNHLDDTAIVATGAGEFGIWYRTVSDDILKQSIWKTQGDFTKTVHEVLTTHNYLKSAYSILMKIEAEQEYYPYIKAMAERALRDDRIHGVQRFDDVEYALYGLAKFKKKEDTKIILDRISKNMLRVSNISFRIMKEFPDTAYMQLFQQYYPKEFYYSICSQPVYTPAQYFVEAVASYRNEISARILDSMLNRKPFVSCEGDSWVIRNAVLDGIWDNDCPAYFKLRKQIEPEIKEREKYQIKVPDHGDITFPSDSSSEKIRWWP